MSVVGVASRSRVVGMRGGAAASVALGCMGVLAVALAGCGQRGPLVLPGAKPSKSVAHQQASAARMAASAPAAGASTPAGVPAPSRAASPTTP